MPPPSVYYNEHDPFAYDWLCSLIEAGHLPPGEVDERDIQDVSPDDLRPYTQCHFFAGIGGWPYALSLAGWPQDRPIWTGSCPCQPYSIAGRGKGADDPRNLWLSWFRLIRECRPPVVVGEQVEGAICHGWLDTVAGDLEGEGYAVGATVLGAHSVGAPHRRQRLYFVADTRLQQWQWGTDEQRPSRSHSSERHEEGADGERGCATGVVADTLSAGRAERGAESGNRPLAGSLGALSVADTPRERSPRQHALLRLEEGRRGTEAVSETAGGGESLVVAKPQGEQYDWRGYVGRGWGESTNGGGLGHADDPRSQGRRLRGHGADQRPTGAAGVDGELGNTRRERQRRAEQRATQERSGNAQSGIVGQLSDGSPRSGGAHFWFACDYLPCLDGKSRPVEPGTFPLAHGVSARVGRLRGYGNAIVPQVAAEFLRAYQDVRDCR